MISLPQILILLQQYGYFLIFPVAVIEGPIIMIISGLLVSLGVLNGYIVYAVLVVGDLTGDVLYYCMGKYLNHSPRIKKLAKFFGYNESSEKFLEEHFEKHKGKTFMIAKLSHGVGATVLVAAGIANVDFWQFLWWNLLATLPKTLILLTIGYYLGSSYTKIDTYLSHIALFTVSFAILLIVLYILFNKFAKNFFSKK